MRGLLFNHSAHFCVPVRCSAAHKRWLLFILSVIIGITSRKESNRLMNIGWSETKMECELWMTAQLYYIVFYKKKTSQSRGVTLGKYADSS